MSRFPLALALLLGACDSTGTLIVQVRTDLAPSTDFAAVRTTVRAPDGTTRVLERAAFQDIDWGLGVRVAETPLPSGSYRLMVAAVAPSGDVLVERPVRVDIGDRLEVVTVLLTRSCVGVECPAPEGDPAAQACLAGRCVQEGCIEEDATACGVRDCTTSADCPAMSGECAEVECTATGACYVALDHARCADGTCSPSGTCEVASCPPLGGTRLAAGASNFCAYTPGGSIECWGENNGLAFGADVADPYLRPTVVHPDRSYASIALGPATFCGVDDTGAMTCAGTDYAGELGTGEPVETHSSFPIPQVPPVTSATHVAAHGATLCAIDGTELRCWGANGSGQLGQGTQTDYELSPVVVPGSWTHVDLADFHACGVQTDGGLYCWGTNAGGQLGIPPAMGVVYTPTPIGTDLDWVQAVAGHDFSCGLRTDGSAWCWGQDYVGQLGDGPSGPVTPEDPREVLISQGTRWERIEGYNRHVCGLRDDASLWCWGWNLAGQAGGGDGLEGVQTPIEPLPGQRFRDFGVGTAATCALDMAGRVTCWGTNERGALGTGAVGDPAFVPQDVCR